MSQVEFQMPTLSNLINDDLSSSASPPPLQQQQFNQVYTPLFPKATTLLVNTGNVVSTERLHANRTNKSSSEEVEDILNNTLSTWLQTITHDDDDDDNKTHAIQTTRSIECRHPKYMKKIDINSKDDISVSVKIFLNSMDPSALTRAITTILEELGADAIDSLIISLPDKLFKQGELNKDLFVPLWLAAQNEINNEKRVQHVGLADLNAIYLQQVLDCLEDKAHIPYLNQVNLSSCCKIPEDLQSISKINNIKLTTHVDPKEILTVDNLQSTIRKYTHDYDSQGWEHLWIARYTLLLKGRGIVQSKGYILNCQRELRYTK